MSTLPLQLLLADDDVDDCMFFREALEELPVKSSLKTVNDGEQLMEMLNTNVDSLPDILFLDLNMPRKNGFECLSEIKISDKLKELPVIIYSTSLDYDVVNLLYEKGAKYYVRKPGEFAKLKTVILEVLTSSSPDSSKKTTKENFIIQL